jgi:hypothetical protein
MSVQPPSALTVTLNHAFNAWFSIYNERQKAAHSFLPPIALFVKERFLLLSYCFLLRQILLCQFCHLFNLIERLILVHQANMPRESTVVPIVDEVNIAHISAH